MSSRIRLHCCLALLILSLHLVSAAAVSADAARVIELKDGSRISGIIVDYERGIYTVETDMLGRLQLPDAKIRSIHSPSTQRTNPDLSSSGAATLSQLEHMQNRIMLKPGIVPLVLSLQHDPGVLAVLNDPEIMQDIASGQVARLQQNPKIRQLEGNPTIQEIIRLLDQ